MDSALIPLIPCIQRGVCKYVTAQLSNYLEEKEENVLRERKMLWLLEVAARPSAELSKAKAALCPIGKCLQGKQKRCGFFLKCFSI